MHIESGFLKGKKLIIQHSGLRPTTSMVKSALMNKIAPFLEGSTFVDCFAGSGSVGFESISRGASKVFFVEKDKQACLFLKKNIAALKIESNTRILPLDVFDFLSSKKVEADFLFFSPPYDTIHWNQLIVNIAISPLLEDKTQVIIQHPTKIRLENANLVLKETRVYGFNSLSFFQKGIINGNTSHRG